MLRSVVSVIVGYLVVALATVATFAVAFPEGTRPTTPESIALLVAGFADAVLGGYVTATIAGRSELRHAFYLGVLMVGLGLASTRQGGGAAPLWFQLGLVAVAVPGPVLGAWLRVKQRG